MVTIKKNTKKNTAVSKSPVGESSELRKKPWNRVSLPVYSISTKEGDTNNMNICTYVSAVSMQPKRMLVAIYEGTKTLELVNKTGHFVLQILPEYQYRLVDLLGKKSGNTINKIGRLEKRKLIAIWNGFKILQDALAVMELKVINTMEGGDHKLFLCDVAAYKNLNGGTVLTLDVLRQHKLIRV
jgi:flavin reductase (DIM6/NTAB) family NADH-FMN oxidoreductase RutF